MSTPRAQRDVALVLRRRWVLPVIALVVAVVAAIVTELVAGDSEDVALLLAVAGVAGVAGLVVGVLAIFVVEALDGTIRGARDLVRLTSAPNLAVVPRHQIGTERPEDVAMFREPNSVEAEGYRSLRTALEFVLWPPDSRGPKDSIDDLDAAALRPLGDGPGKVVLVTSARPGEGKSSVAANLAAASAMAGRRVVLVDGDLRKPQVHRLFRLGNDVGLSSMLTGELKGFAAVQRLAATKHLVVVSGGPPPPDPAELLAGPRLGAALASMASQSDLVVVDGPPLLAVTDPALIAQYCDATIMVAILGESDRREWAEAVGRIALVKAEVIGTVLMQPDKRVNAAMADRYTPGAAPKDWWCEGPTDAATTTSTADGASALGADGATPPTDLVDLDRTLAARRSLGPSSGAEDAVETSAPTEIAGSVAPSDPPEMTDPNQPMRITRSQRIEDQWPPPEVAPVGRPDETPEPQHPGG